MHLIRRCCGAAALAVLAGAAPAVAAPAVDPAFSTLSGKPRHLALGPDGNVWTPLSDSTKEIARIAPDGTVTEYDVDTLSNAEGITSDGTNLWVTRTGGVARFSPADPAGAVATPIPAITDPRAITVGPDGNLWTASGDKVVHFSPSNPAGFAAQTISGMGARGIAALTSRTTSGATGGAVYVADFLGQRLIDVPISGPITTIPLAGGPQEVAVNGTQVVVSNPGAVPQTVARIMNDSPFGLPITMPTTDPFGIAVGNDGGSWVARFAAGDLARIDADGSVTTLPIGAGTGPRQITKGPGDTLFVGLETAMKVARVSGVSAPPPPTPTPTPTPMTPVTMPAARLTIGHLRLTAGRRLQVTVSLPATVRFRVRGHTFTVRARDPGTVSARIPRSITLRAVRYRVTARAQGAGQTATTRRTLVVIAPAHHGAPAR